MKCRATIALLLVGISLLKAEENQEGSRITRSERVKDQGYEYSRPAIKSYTSLRRPSGEEDPIASQNLVPFGRDTALYLPPKNQRLPLPLPPNGFQATIKVPKISDATLFLAQNAQAIRQLYDQDQRAKYVVSLNRVPQKSRERISGATLQALQKKDRMIVQLHRALNKIIKQNKAVRQQYQQSLRVQQQKPQPMMTELPIMVKMMPQEPQNPVYQLPANFLPHPPTAYVEPASPTHFTIPIPRIQEPLAPYVHPIQLQTISPEPYVQYSHHHLQGLDPINLSAYPLIPPGLGVAQVPYISNNLPAVYSTDVSNNLPAIYSTDVTNNLPAAYSTDVSNNLPGAYSTDVSNNLQAIYSSDGREALAPADQYLTASASYQVQQ